MCIIAPYFFYSVHDFILDGVLQGCKILHRKRRKFQEDMQNFTIFAAKMK